MPVTLMSQGTSGGLALRLSVHVYSSRSRGRLDETYCSPVGLARSIECGGVRGECGDGEDNSVGRNRLRGPAARAVMQMCESKAKSETRTISGNATRKEFMPSILINAGQCSCLYTRTWSLRRLLSFAILSVPRYWFIQRNKNTEGGTLWISSNRHLKSKLIRRVRGSHCGHTINMNAFGGERSRNRACC